MNRTEQIKNEYRAKKEPYLVKSDNVGIYGSIKVWITRETGKKELVFEDKNAIQSDYADIIVDALQGTVDFDMDSLFNGYTTPPTEDEDGIAIYDNVGGNWYEMNMATTVRSAGWVTFTGTFTGVGITVANTAGVMLGHKWENAVPDFTSVGDAYGKFAIPSSWASQAVGAGETLTIEWIIKHQAT